MRRFFITLLLVILPLQLGFLYSKDSQKSESLVAGLKTEQSQPILNSISIGDFHFALFGYTSPHAEVTFDGQGIYDKTYADSNGFFKFNNRFSPFSPREACLSSKDQFGRISFPVCLPAFPIKYNVSIGPVLIPPTLSLNQEYYYLNDQITLSGQTIPNSDVNLSVFTKEGKVQAGVESNVIASTSMSLRAERSNLSVNSAKQSQKGIASSTPRDDIGKVINSLLAMTATPVEAFSFPELIARSDSKGNFSLSLPSSNPDTFRLLAQTKFNSSMSPTSIKLNFEVMPVWMIIIQFFTLILSLIKGRWLEMIIIGEILVVLYFILPLIFHHKNLAIILKKDELPAIPDRYPLVIN